MSSTPQIHNRDAIPLTCNLAEAGAFSSGYQSPPAVVIAAFAGGPMHECRVSGKLNLTKAVADHPQEVIRSSRLHLAGATSDRWEEIILQFGPQEFVAADLGSATAYSPSHERAGTLLRDFFSRYEDKSEKPSGSYHLLSKEGRDISSKRVAVSSDSILSDEKLETFYADEMVAWDRDFLGRLADRQQGFALLEGEPGTGKTTYLRHLIATLRGTHRFYYIPSSGLEMVVDPEFVGFWANERSCHKEQTFAVIFEDADSAIMTREADNREVVSAVLNLTDGLLGNFLRLQILCTINCTSTTIDPALLRPGRLLAHRKFPRLPASYLRHFPESASLPHRPDYTLAEILHCQPDPAANKLPIGFSTRG